MKFLMKALPLIKLYYVQASERQLKIYSLISSDYRYFEKVGRVFILN
jgi:hypothetical protein